MKCDVEKQYFEWLRGIVGGHHKYDTLLNALYNTEFIAEYKMDKNRISDGLDLKDRFCYEENYRKNLMRFIIFVLC